MNKFLKLPIIVEGLSDKNKILSFCDANILVTNGFDINKEIIEYLRTNQIEVILFLDPDDSGEHIRNKIKQSLGNAVDIRIERKITNKKYGVAEANIEDVKNVLNDYLLDCNSCNKLIKKSDLQRYCITNNKTIKELIGDFAKQNNFKELNENEFLFLVNIINNSTLGELKHGNK